MSTFAPNAEQIAEHDDRNRAMHAGCPFYAVSLVQLRTVPPSWVLARDFPSVSNRCAIITSAHSPCWMETEENVPPDWESCPRNPEYFTTTTSTQANRERVARHLGFLGALDLSAARNEPRQSGMSREAATATAEWDKRFPKTEP